MESGFVIDKTGKEFASGPEWAEGVPEPSFWMGLKMGLNLAGRERHAVVTYRCSACGYLESYAPSM
jgi:hypothetical protein